MELSTNSFTVKTITESSTSPTKLVFGESAEPTNEREFPYSNNSVTGMNLSGGKFGDDELFSGQMYGKEEFGGISRFKNR